MKPHHPPAQVTDVGHEPATPVRRRWLAHTRHVVAVMGLLVIPALTRAQADSGRTLVVGSEEDYPPFATGKTDETAGGFTVDLWKAVAVETGLTYAIRVGPFHRILDEFKAGKVDVLINLAQSEQRRAFADFSVPHVIVHGAIFVRTGEPGISSEADLAGKSVIVIDADLAHDYAVSLGWGPHLVLVENAAEGLELLASGQHDAMLLGKIAGLQTLQRLKIRNVRALDAKAGFSQKFAFAVRKGNADLLATINEGLAIAKSRGTYDALYEKSFGLLEPAEVTLRQLLQYLGPVVLTLVIAAGLFLVRRHERAKGEHRLRDSEERLRLAMSAAQQGLYDLNVQTGDCIVSPEYALMLGYDPAGFHETNAAWRERLHPDDREAVYAAYSDYVAGRRPEYRVEFRQRTKDGAWKWILSLGSIVARTADGQPLRMLGTHTDITERKMAAEALREREERLRAALTASGTGTFRWDIRTNELNWDEALDALFGLPKGQTVHSLEKFIATVHPDDRPGVVERCERCAREGADFEMEFRVTWPDGAIHWLDDRGKTFFDAAGKPLYMTGACVDISERKRAAEALSAVAEFSMSLIGSMQDGFSVLDADGRQVDVNPAFCRMTGFSREELIGASPPYPYWPPEELGRIGAALSETLKGHVANFELTFMRKNGERFPVIVSPGVVRNQAGDAISYSATVKDITERKSAEEALERSEERFRTLTESAPILIYLTDEKGDCIYVNPRWCEAAGLTPEQAAGQGWLNGVHEEDRATIGEVWKRSVESGGTWGFEYRFKTPAGVVTWVYGTAAPIRAANGRVLGFVGTNVDITERRQAAMQRQQLDRQMQETQKLESLGVLAGGIAHDFNNLLTNILGNASIAALELPPGSPVHECLEHINEASLRAADLCKQMLAYSGRGRFVVQKLDLGELIEQTTQMLQISISKKAVLRFRFEKGLPPIEVDATQIRQVIMNLVINASEAIGDASGVIGIVTGLTHVDREYLASTLKDPDVAEGDYVSLEVSDSGCGMSEETRARMFEPFFTTKFTGRGLGLAAVLGIMRGHKGALKVYSEPGRGTTIKLLFPAAAGPGEAGAASPAGGLNWRGNGTVLVVDDEETIRSTAGRMMRIIGLEPVLVSDGREAVEAFRTQPERFALVLLDLTMPHMDGVETFTELRRLRPDVRVVLMSGFDAQEALVRFPGKGLASFLQKPFTIASLTATMKEVLNRTEA